MNGLAKPIFLKINRTLYEVTSLEDASRKYCQARDAFDGDASEFPGVDVVDECGEPVARVSYNGRVWPPGEWKNDAVPLYDNR